jgi:hypothetical protein
MTDVLGRTLVLGAAVGYTEQQIAPFLVSLRKTGYSGDITLFVEPAAARRFRKQPLFEGVSLVPASQWFPLRYRLLKRPKALRFIWHPLQLAMWGAVRLLGLLPLGISWRMRLQIPLALQIYPPTEGRFLRYFRLLQSRPYSRVLLSDVRDVLFQTEPFAHLPERGLAVSIEPRHYVIATQAWNAHWVRELYGAEVLCSIGEMPVSCSGVTYGDGESMLRYLQMMTQAILKLSRQAARHGWFDQAIHNVILWTHQAGEPYGLESFASAVATLGAVKTSEMALSDDGKILNRDGSIVSILHQYDRHPALKSLLLATLNGPASELHSAVQTAPSST